MLRRGNRHSAQFWRRVLLLVMSRYRELKIPKFFRGDAAFASPPLMTVLDVENSWDAIRLKANAVLERPIAHLRKRPVGRPSTTPKVIDPRLPVPSEAVGSRPAGGGQDRSVWTAS
jgi:hypothetical protein